MGGVYLIVDWRVVSFPLSVLCILHVVFVVCGAFLSFMRIFMYGNGVCICSNVFCGATRCGVCMVALKAHATFIGSLQPTWNKKAGVQQA